MARAYDFKLAKQIIETFVKITDVETIYMGMHEDWFWTTDIVWLADKFTESFKTETIAGINQSDWATPVIQVNLKNGNVDFRCSG